MTDFAIGCTHFGHANIIRLAHRPFESVAEMDEVLIENWNRKVKPDDTVYHLGDFSWYHPSKTAEVLSKLNGHIVAIQGNHDPLKWGQPYLELTVQDKGLVLCHYPIEEWNGWWKGTLHIHCHTHKPEFHSAERRGNVTVEAIGYAPIALTDIIDMLT